MLNFVQKLIPFKRDHGLSSEARKILSARYIRGRGIEIGALHNPLWIRRFTRVVYVDRLADNELRDHYPELANLKFVNVDIIDDGEKLASFKKDSLDFIIANHFIEHTENPVGTIRRHLEVLKTGGVLFMAIPDRRYTFDRARPETDFDHLLKDHLEGPQWSYESHLREYAELVMGCTPDTIDATVNDLKKKQYSIHFHVWSEESLRDFLSNLIERLHFPMKIEEFVSNTSVWGENICILRKVDNDHQRSDQHQFAFGRLLGRYIRKNS